MQILLIWCVNGENANWHERFDTLHFQRLGGASYFVGGGIVIISALKKQTACIAQTTTIYQISQHHIPKKLTGYQVRNYKKCFAQSCLIFRQVSLSLTLSLSLSISIALFITVPVHPPLLLPKKRHKPLLLPSLGPLANAIICPYSDPRDGDKKLLNTGSMAHSYTVQTCRKKGITYNCNERENLKKWER